jgi:hypothetical protein
MHIKSFFPLYLFQSNDFIFPEHGGHSSFFKDSCFKNVLKQKTPVISGLYYYWLECVRRNLVLFQVPFWFSVGLPTKEFPVESFLALLWYCHMQKGNESHLFVL